MMPWAALGSVTCTSGRWFFFSALPHSEYCFWALHCTSLFLSWFLVLLCCFYIALEFKFCLCLFKNELWNSPLRLASISLGQVPRRARDCRAAETPAMATVFPGTGTVCWYLCAPVTILYGQTLLLSQGRVIHLRPPDETVLWFIQKLFWIRLVNFCLDFSCFFFFSEGLATWYLHVLWWQQLHA